MHEGNERTTLRVHETILSILWRKYHVDHMSVRGKLRSKLFFGMKIGAFNISKFYKAMQEREKCSLSAANA